MDRRIKATILALLLASGLTGAWAATGHAASGDAAASAASPATPSESAPGTSEAAVAWEPRPEETLLVQLINEARKAAGLDPVAPDPALCLVARAHAEEMIRDGYFGHVSKMTGTPADRVRKAGVKFRAVFENLAGHPSASVAEDALMKSPGHRRNILRAGVTEVGVAYVAGGPYGGMVVEIFVEPASTSGR